MARLLMVCGCVAVLLAASSPSHALPIQCVRPNSGPCMAADTFDLQFDSVNRPVVTMNFGVVFPEGAAHVPVCEEAFGGRTPQSIVVTPSGFMAVAARTGVYRGRLNDACTWTLAKGIADNTFVHQVIADPSAPNRLWALVGAGNDRGLYVSEDQGETFALRYAFPSGQVWWRLVAVASPQLRLYVAGPGAGAAFSLGVSADEGFSFVVRDAVGELSDPLRTTILLGASTQTPPRLFFARDTPAVGDEIWMSTDEGLSAARVLQLPPGHLVGGFSLGATPQTVYVASRTLLVSGRAEDAALFVSSDQGLTWAPPVNGGALGPRFRCLKWHQGALYACGGGVDANDAFYVGRSLDGQTWEPLVTTQTLGPVPACLRDRCLDTTAWLCGTYGICAPSSDGGVGDASTETPAAQGCRCRVGRPQASHGWMGMGVWAAVLGALLRRRRRNRDQARKLSV